MIKYLIILTLLISPHYLCGQNNLLNGHIFYQNSGLSPAVGVSLYGTGAKGLGGANIVYTTNKGKFQLRYTKKIKGDAAAISVGNTDGEGKPIIVVNHKMVSTYRIPSSPNDGFEIIVAHPEKLEAAKIRYFKILENSGQIALKKQQARINFLMSQQKRDNREIIALQLQKDSLENSLNTAKKEWEAKALFIASINLDRSNKLVKNAVQQIQEGQGVEKALAILDPASLDEIHEQNQGTIENSRKSEQQVIEGHAIRANLLSVIFKFPEAIKALQKAIDIHQINNFDQIELADWYRQLGNAFSKNGNYKKALKNHEKGIGILNQFKSLPTRTIRPFYNDLGRLHNQVGNYEKAITYITEAIKLEENLANPNPQALARLYNHYGDNLSAKGAYREALVIFEKSSEFYGKSFPKDHPEYSALFNNFSNVLHQLGATSEALAYQLQANVIHSKHYGAESPQMMVLNNNTALLLNNLDRQEEALAYCKKHINFMEKTLHPNHPNIAMGKNNLSLILSNLGQKREAILAAKEGIRIVEEVLAPNHPLMFNFNNNLGLIYTEVDSLNLAKKHLEKALDVLKQTQSPNLANELKLYTNLGTLYYRKKNYPKAVDYFEKAAKGYQQNTNYSNFKDIQLVNRNLAHTYSKQRNYPAAAKLLRDLIVFEEKHSDISKETTANTKIGLSESLIHLKEFVEAKTILKEALKVLNNATKDQGRITALGYFYLSKVEKELGSSSRSIIALKKGIAAYPTEKRTQTDSTNLATYQRTMGNRLIDINLLKEALQSFSKAYNLESSFLSADHPNIALTKKGQGLAYFRGQDLIKAKSYFEESLAVLGKTPDVNPLDLFTIHSHLGQILVVQEAYEKAILHLSQTISLLPNNPYISILNKGKIYASLSWAYYNTQKNDLAKKSIETALGLLENKVNPSLLDNLFSNAGDIYNTADNLPLAIKYYLKSTTLKEKALQQNDPILGVMQTKLGIAYLNNKNYFNSQVYLQKALDNFTQSLPPTHSLFATVYQGICINQLKLKNYPAAKTANELYLEKKPSGKKEEYYRYQGRIAVAEGQLAAAKTAFEAYEKLHPTFSEVHLNWVHYFNKMKDVNQVILHLEKAMELGLTYIELEELIEEKEFVNIQKKERFKRFLKKQKQQQK